MGGCHSRSPNTDLLLKFFLANFQNDRNFSRFFRFFQFMISPPNRLFLAYLPKKIFPFKILWTCRFFSYNNFFSVQLTYKHPVAVFQSDRNLCSLFAPSDYAVLKFSFFSCNVQGHSDVIIFAIFRFFYFMISPPNRPFLAYLPKKIFPCYFYGLVNF